MTFTINRYSLDKHFISVGTLTISSEGQKTNLSFSDNIIEVSSSELYHPLVALASLRLTLEKEYSSLIACNGCRRDTSYRPTGGYNTYLIVACQQATKLMNMFNPTDQVEKLCTVDEHKMAYKDWLDSLSEN